MKRLAVIAIFASSILFFTVGMARVAFPWGPWPQFRGDAAHTGRSDNEGPLRGILAWTHQSTDTRSSPAIAGDGTVYAGNASNRLLALNSTGSLLWSYVAGSRVKSSPALNSWKVFAGSDDNRVYGINATTGTLSWTYVTGGDVLSSPSVSENVYVGSEDHRLYAIDPITGALSWTYVTGDAVWYSPAVGPDGRVFVASYDYRLYAINSNGSLSWTYGGGEIFLSTAIDSDGRVYMGANTNRMYRLNANGSFSWSYRTGDKVYSSPALGDDGRVYFGSDDNRVYALNSTGSLSWSYMTGDNVQSSPAIDSGGRVYVGSWDYRVYALTPTGSLLWSYNMSYYVYSSPAIGAGGELCIGGSGDVYCFQVPDSLAILVREGASDLNIYFWNTPADSDWTRWDAMARNPSPLARDLWQIPIGNDGIGVTSIDIGSDDLALLVRQASNDLNIYFWNAPVAGDWTYWDALARNPSPLARDFWQIPIGNDGIGLTEIDISGDDLALLVRQASNDLNIYFWNSPVEGDWTRWDALARNPSPLARDFWQIPIGNDGIGLTSIDIDGIGKDEIALLVRQGVNDLNVYFWNAPVAGDWTRWDALARNPSPLARDFWQIPIGNDGIGITAIDVDGNEKDEIGLLVRQGANDLNIYFWNAPVPGDWTRWDALARNPSPLARDFWQIPVGNDGIGLTGLAM